MTSLYINSESAEKGRQKMNLQIQDWIDNTSLIKMYMNFTDLVLFRIRFEQQAVGYGTTGK